MADQNNQFPQYTEPNQFPQYGQEAQSPYAQPQQTEQPQQFGQFDQQGYSQAQQQYGQFDQQAYTQAQQFDQQPQYAQAQYQPAGLKTSGKAIGSLVCSIIGLFFAGVILGIVSIVLGAKGRKECDAGVAKARDSPPPVL